jgi:ABC-type polysaccharide/polyol phosphate transport system ATPase subunit
MSRSSRLEGSVTASHLWKRYRADSHRSEIRELVGRAIGRGSGHRWNWVLRDVEVDVPAGESVALVGLNGSGKSTLLKILAGVTQPNAGQVDVRGRVGALIEVRAGIHPDLTGRENTYFYGTVLGLTRREVAARFDQIVEFAELGDAIDRQVKFYSSGMQMRLGFSIAAFLEPDVLLVDEALAVGDVGFQQRCLERMRYVLSQGTTLLFVSHDMAAVETLCQRAMWLDDGVVRADGPTAAVLASYRVGLEEKAGRLAELLDDPVRLGHFQALSPQGSPPETGRPLELVVSVESELDVDVDFCIGVSEGPAAPIFTLTRGLALRSGRNDLRCLIDNLPLPRGRYYVWMGAFGHEGVSRMQWHPAAPLDVVGPTRQPPPRGVMLLSPVYVSATWDARGVASSLSPQAPSSNGRAGIHARPPS